MDPGTLQKNIAHHRRLRSLRADQSLCSAPSVGLYFNADGSVGACCYNRKNLFGRYPKNSINEIWSSVERSLMEKSLKNDVFPEGCSRCRDEVYKSSNVQILAQRFDPLVALARMPITMEFELGTVCNLECVMCNGWVSSAIRKNREKLPPLKSPYDDEFIRQLSPFVPHVADAKFLGGEPFLNRLNFLVWDLFAKQNKKAEISITTNGTVLNDRVKEVLTELNPWLVISIESLDDQTYEKIRKNADGKKVKKNIDWLIENRYLRALTVCVMPSNWQDIPGIVSFCNLNGLNVHFNTVFEPFEHSMHSLSKDELERAWKGLALAEIQQQVTATQKTVGHNSGKYANLIEQLRALYVHKYGTSG